MQEQGMLLVFPVEALVVLFVSLCRIPAVVSFLESLWALPGTVPSVCPTHRLSPQLFLKRLEFNQNIHFLLNPFKAQCIAACFLFHCLVMRRVRGEEEDFGSGAASKLFYSLLCLTMFCLPSSLSSAMAPCDFL